MTSSSARTLNRVAAAGLLVGAVFGLAGALVASPQLQASLWAIDSVPTATPLPFFAYPFLVATLLGWAWTLVREK